MPHVNKWIHDQEGEVVVSSATLDLYVGMAPDGDQCSLILVLDGARYNLTGVADKVAVEVAKMQRVRADMPATREG